MTVTRPLQLTSKPPAVDRATVYGRGSMRFPVVTLEFDSGRWDMKEQYVYGSLSIREVVLSTLVGTRWPVRFVPRAKGESRRPPPPQAIGQPPDPPQPAAPAPAIIPKAPPVPRDLVAPKPERYPVADFFFENDWGLLMPAHGRLVAITQPDVPLVLLSEIPLSIFQQAVRWALGRNPREGDRLAFTAGPHFVHGGLIEECLILCPEIPKSRHGYSYPKVWMEYREGGWAVLTSENRGKGAAELANAVVGTAPWRIETGDSR